MPTNNTMAGEENGSNIFDLLKVDGKTLAIFNVQLLPTVRSFKKSF